MTSRKLTGQDIYSAAQSPVGWLLSAERLRDGAEAIIAHEVQFEIPFFQAYDVATKLAVSIAYSEGNDSGSAPIEAKAPNYPAAQLLYAYATENVLKGLIVANNAGLIGGDRLNAALNSHNLEKLAKDAGFEVYVQEASVLKALSQLSVWAGRYPVALYKRDYVRSPNSDELLDYGSQNPIMRMFFNRAQKVLESKLPKPIENKFGAVVVFRQPGT